MIFVIINVSLIAVAVAACVANFLCEAPSRTR